MSRAWRNIIKGAYPRATVRWRSIVAAVFAGVGVNAIIPARGGDAVRVVLAKRSVEGSSYATIASTLVLLSLFDFVVATCLVIWAAVTGRLPKVLGPSFDFSWAFHNPGTFLKVVAVVFAVVLVLVLWFAEQIGDFRRRLTQGFAILRDRRAYFRFVALWQGVDWTLRFVAVLFFLQRVRASGHLAQRAARTGLGRACVAPADQPVRDRDRAGVPALPASRPGF